MSKSAGAIYQAKSKQPGVNFDPRTKILLLVALDVLLFMGRSLAYEASIILFCAIILLIDDQSRSALKYMGIFALFVIAQRFIAPFSHNSLASLVYFVVVVVRKILPCLMLGQWLIATTEVSSFVAAMWKWKLPKQAIVTTSVVFRCFPTIREEWDAIQSAMKMRGIGFNFKHMVTKPSKTIVYMLVPLFISVLNISDELAAAALCRGLDNPGQHTCMEDIRFRWYDIVFLIIVAVSFVGICLLKAMGLSL